MTGFSTPPNHIGFEAKKLFGEAGRVRDVAIAILQPNGGGPEPAHSHAHDHLFVVTEGAARIDVAGEEIALRKNEAYLVNGMLPHSVWNASERTTVMLGITIGA